MKRHVQPVAWLAVWLAVALTAVTLALAFVLAQEPSELQLTRAHTAGMALGHQMCIGYRAEMERAPAPMSAPMAHPLGGLL